MSSDAAPAAPGREPASAAAPGSPVRQPMLLLSASLAAVIARLARVALGFLAVRAAVPGSVARLPRTDGARAGSCAAWLPATLAVAALATFGSVAAPALAGAIPSPFLQQMIRAEPPQPPPPAGMAPLSPIRIGGLAVLLGHTPIAAVGRRLEIPVEHQGDAGDSVYWFCVRLDVPARTARPPRDAAAPTLWVIADAEASAAHAVTAIALDTVRGEGRRCPVPRREVDLTLDARIARPGASLDRVAALYGHAPMPNGRSAYGLPGMQPDAGPLSLTLLLRNRQVETSWLAGTPED